MLLATLRYALSYLTLKYYSNAGLISYRLAFASAASTYGIVVYKAYRARMRSGQRKQGGGIALLGDENVQYLGRCRRAYLLWMHYLT